MIGRILGIHRNVAKRHFKKGGDDLDDAWPNGRPSILSEDEHEDLIRKILEPYEMRRPMSIGEVHYYIESRYQKSIDRHTVWHVLRRDPRIKSCKGLPMEARIILANRRISTIPRMYRGIPDSLDH
jgi:hypothetical protein